MQISINIDGKKVNEYSFGKHKIKSKKDVRLYSNMFALGLSFFNLDKLVTEKVYEIFEPFKWLLGYSDSTPLIKYALLFAIFCIFFYSFNEIRDFINRSDNVWDGAFRFFKIFLLVILGVCIIF